MPEYHIVRPSRNHLKTASVIGDEKSGFFLSVAYTDGQNEIAFLEAEDLQSFADFLNHREGWTELE